jgi:hypothetical protein
MGDPGRSPDACVYPQSRTLFCCVVRASTPPLQGERHGAGGVVVVVVVVVGGTVVVVVVVGGTVVVVVDAIVVVVAAGVHKACVCAMTDFSQAAVAWMNCARFPEVSLGGGLFLSTLGRVWI